MALLQQLQQQTDNLASARRTPRSATPRWCSSLLLAWLTGLFVPVVLRPAGVLRRPPWTSRPPGLPEEVQRSSPTRTGRGRAGSGRPGPIHTKEEVASWPGPSDRMHPARRSGWRPSSHAAGQRQGHVRQPCPAQPGLVERQLGLIAGWSRTSRTRTSWPTCRADHLAISRMAAATAENLLVLSGTDLGRRLTRPVRPATFIGAAVSEVEQYARIQVRADAGADHAGPGRQRPRAPDRELLDNATRSPTRTPRSPCAPPRRGAASWPSRSTTAAWACPARTWTRPTSAWPTRPRSTSRCPRRNGPVRGRPAAQAARHQGAAARQRGHRGRHDRACRRARLAGAGPGAEVNTPPSGPSGRGAGRGASPRGSHGPAPSASWRSSRSRCRSRRATPALPVQFVSSAAARSWASPASPRWCRARRTRHRPGAGATPQGEHRSWIPSMEDSAPASRWNVRRLPGTAGGAGYPGLSARPASYGNGKWRFNGNGQPERPRRAAGPGRRPAGPVPTPASRSPSLSRA